MGKTIMRVRGLTKVFGSLTANDHIDLDIEAGRIHAIAGENGAGKSTLMKMLYGVYPATEGTIIVDETPVNGWNPALARENGVSMVFQDFRLIPAFTVLENVFLSLTGRRYVINRKDLRQRIRALSETYQLNVEPDQEVWKLDLGQRQHIEIIKALINPNTRMLIFDEPTSVLAPHEIARFLDMLLQFRADGYAVLLITHKIHEITTVSDQITILRQGKKVCAINREDGFDQAAIIAGMLGEQTMEEAPEKPAAREFPQLPGIALRAVTVRDDHNREILQNVNMELARGRIMGIAGISGNGQRELTEAIFGARKISGGHLSYGGEDITHTSPGQRIRHGFRMVTEDPLHDNVVESFTVLQNMALAGLDVTTTHGRIDWEDLRQRLAERPEMEAMKVPAGDRLAGTLSGGNVQRMTFARAVISQPSLLLACYPSRGLDVATVAEVHRTLLRLRDAGTAIVLVSEDLPELFAMSDSLTVLAGHQALGPFIPSDCDIQELGKLMLKGGGGNAAEQTP
ncbi:MAG: ATP-binding cassette domain-containing protein [Oscillospiraceae bacterium]|nr:ATP-binding cassette domain-containing protein [Oscillospiraceae bacterium]